MAVPVNLADRDCIIQTASTALQSKVVSQNAALLAPIACDAVMEVSAEQMRASLPALPSPPGLTLEIGRHFWFIAVLVLSNGRS